jgi:hypothetical protein
MPAVSRLALGANLGRRLGPGFFNGLLARDLSLVAALRGKFP